MLMEILELYSIKRYNIVSDFFPKLFQCKIGSFLFIAITTKLDITFAILHFFQLNLQPGPKYYETADRVFYYLFVI